MLTYNYVSQVSYTRGQKIAYESNTYVALKNFLSSTLEIDVSSGNLSMLYYEIASGSGTSGSSGINGTSGSSGFSGSSGSSGVSGSGGSGSGTSGSSGSSGSSGVSGAISIYDHGALLSSSVVALGFVGGGVTLSFSSGTSVISIGGGSTSGNVAYNTTVTADNLTIQIKTNSSGYFLHAGCVTGNPVYYYATTLIQSTSATALQGNIGSFTASNSVWNLVGDPLFSLDNPGEMAESHIIDNSAGRTYRVNHIYFSSSSNYVAIQRVV